MTAAPAPRITYSEYVAAEKLSDTKHEYVNGQIYAMAGGTIEHGAIAANLIRILGNALSGRPCRVLTSDVRVTVHATGLSTYPDVTVVCGQIEKHPEDDHAITHPTLLVEVLSASTEAWDRGQKAAHYRAIPSLREYVLVSQSPRHVEVYRRTDHGTWELFEAKSGSIAVASIDGELQLDAVYEDPLASQS